MTADGPAMYGTMAEARAALAELNARDRHGWHGSVLRVGAGWIVEVRRRSTPNAAGRYLAADGTVGRYT